MKTILRMVSILLQKNHIVIEKQKKRSAIQANNQEKQLYFEENMEMNTADLTDIGRHGKNSFS